jgi:hypothetical protein
MSPSPGLLLTFIVIQNVGLLLLSLFVALAWMRLRAIETAHSRAIESQERRLQTPEGPAHAATAQHADHEPAPLTAARRHPGPPVVRLAGSTLRADPAEPSAVSGPTLIAVPKLSATTPSHATATVTRELGLRFGPIWELADAGETADSIARSTGQPVGQIELILALRRQATSVADGSRHG